MLSGLLLLLIVVVRLRIIIEATATLVVVAVLLFELIVVVVVLRLVKRSCRFYIALWLGKDGFEHAVQVRLILLSAFSLNFLFAEPEVDEERLAR